MKEIEFEKFRQNYSFATVEEIAQDLEKIRNWFGVPGRDYVAVWITRCEKLLEDFYGEVHARAVEHAGGPDGAELEHEVPSLDLDTLAAPRAD